MAFSVHLGPHARAVDAALDQLSSQRFIPRLLERDAGLWSNDASTQAAIRNRLGWLTIPQVMAQEAAPLAAFAREVREDGCRHVLLLGMGGSGLFPEVCRNTFGAASGCPDLTVLDTTDPTAIRTAARRCPATQLLVIVSSKSGSTAEISALSKYFYEVLRSDTKDPGRHCLVITDAGTPLESQAGTWGCRRIFAHGPANGSDVGGRFSALTYFGLVPAALLGVDVGRLLERGRQALEAASPSGSLAANAAVQIGAVLGALAHAGRDKLTLLCPSSLASFGTWVEQIVAESTGKRGRGIVPILGEPRREPSAYGRDRLFLELQWNDRSDPAVARLADALIEAEHPVVRIRWQDPYDLGEEVIRWSIATVVAGGLLGIDPFDEPNVQESKDRTKTLLAAYAKTQQLPSEAPVVTDGNLAIHATATGITGDAGHAIRTFLGLSRPTDYVAILSFLPRTDALDRALQQLRATISARMPNATLVQIGPRYLHSTGQLFKGGADAGVFLLLTADEPSDLAIPGESFSFGVLKQAQALGDFQAMRQQRRRVVRIHLKGNPAHALRRLNGFAAEAAPSAV